MNYVAFKFNFTTAVHFGEGILNSSANTFFADTLFSSLYIESMKLNFHNQLLGYVNDGKLSFSDAFPFSKGQYFLPKPMKFIESMDPGNSSEKKKIKKIKYLPCDQIDDFLNSKVDLDKLSSVRFCTSSEDARVVIRNPNKAEPDPYRVGVCSFNDECGLYVIIGYENQEIFNFTKKIFESLQYSGIGGKRTSGLGKFVLETDQNCCLFKQLIERKSDTYMTISVAYPADDELEMALNGSSYLVASVEAAPSEPRTSLILCATISCTFLRPTFRYPRGSNTSGFASNNSRIPAVKPRRRSESTLILQTADLAA